MKRFDGINNKFSGFTSRPNLYNFESAFDRPDIKLVSLLLVFLVAKSRVAAVTYSYPAVSGRRIGR